MNRHLRGRGILTAVLFGAGASAAASLPKIMLVSPQPGSGGIVEIANTGSVHIVVLSSDPSGIKCVLLNGRRRHVE